MNEIKKINIEDIVPFKNHPFKVFDDESLNDLAQSIQADFIQKKNEYNHSFEMSFCEVKNDANESLLKWWKDLYQEILQW